MDRTEAPERLSLGSTRLLGAVALVFALALAWHAVATWQLFQSRRPETTLSARLLAARIGRTMEPWNPNARADYGYVASQQLLEDGRNQEAVDTMVAAYKDAVGDAEMLAYLRHAQAVLAADR